MGAFTSSNHQAGHNIHAGYGTGSRESLGLLLKVLNEHRPGVLEDLNRVAHFAIATAEGMGLPESEVERVEIAARLHDVGKLAIPDAILTKAAPLDGNEWAIMRTHSEIGQRILAASPSLTHAAKLVRHHHERYDGFGYPDRLAGEDIPIGAAIIAVCAAFVAMMKHRPFSDAITVSEAIAELRRYSGTQFDPRVVDVFCELLRMARS
ncbi:MAG: HD domain-containing phosphohydrolase [Solirubrobacteraceae bacterium]|jgi:response regulator RpfG family c-di-GMP phosphodiesterase